MINLKNITKSFGSQKILDDVSLDVARGEKLAILGQNGAGKSSLMRIVLGEFLPTSGSVSINGFDPLKSRKEALSLISFVPQTPPPLKFSLAELCEFVCKSSNVSFDEIAKFCGELDFSLEQNLSKPFYKLSGGMKQKMLIAVAFAKNTEILMFDEPTANLDVEARGAFKILLKRLAGTKTMVFISHRIDEIDDILQRYVLMDLGKIVKDEILKGKGA
ncbi:ABC transporter ATP-binding protein [Campylobacter curvus]|uniref:ABC transporter ATP-binding protein n=1 Tax=Campylobacter curvus TaxID=200 RepID=UPI001470531E|nr:ABC transporter ATP-binding protein [Campylobacter curvus]